jgi:positive regulator of sigma E activity
MPDNYDDFETGVVIKLQGDTALVELNIKTACESCGARVICAPDGSGKKRLYVANPIHAKIGNIVAISETSGFLLKLSALQYGLPLIGFVTGIFTVYYSGINISGVPPEVTSFSAGLIGLLLASYISRGWAQRLADTGHSFFSIQKIISQRGSPD